ncbi:MAG: hypothetical protein COS19_12775 [Flavobacteriaceae bacterium CG02_land_8_20_14_3_00_34_13]|nr:MAG: hypothetical protein COS19_12775 [Flavobacteriaceae bacterium CG02_land_8_20_14_3_00_34_13]
MIKWYKSSLIISIVIIIIGAIFKILHWQGGKLLFFIGLLISLIYIIIGLNEIFKNDTKSIFEKLLWFLGFILFSWIIGLIYYFSELKPKYKLK